MRFQYSAAPHGTFNIATSLIPILRESHEVANVAEVWERDCGNFLLESAVRGENGAAQALTICEQNVIVLLSE